ncbi:DUF2939 domain-containing protein [Altericroceibacterium endophyticum]|uniref:DUF2939 domain-containing protein n=1 Tax=Altericroceibacterium endophyticum TaxID=1808508 RepID=A0A6I4T3N4_9SPHN|nr:DUF2939 domain-containing protein [Altericroceibacterium endophyticum]MXO64872.1 DUF2939 domain-containing protein [Altericroceibacterium endophyticum]
MSKKLVVAIIAVVLAASVGWYFLSPAYALGKLRDAAVEGDVASLEARIDFASVRESLKSQLKAYLVVEMEREDAGGLEAFGGIIAMGVLDRMIDGLVTPEAMGIMVARGQFKGGQQWSESEGTFPDWTIERTDFDHFRAVPKAEKDSASMVFTRDGLGWKLTKVVIPDVGLNAG